MAWQRFARFEMMKPTPISFLFFSISSYRSIESTFMSLSLLNQNNQREAAIVVVVVVVVRKNMRFNQPNNTEAS